MSFLRIADPDKPGDFLVIHRRDFDPAVHTRVDAPAASADAGTPAPVATPVAAPSAPVAVNIAELTVADALPHITAADTIEAVQALQQQEAGRTPPRTGVLKALKTKLDALTAAAPA